MACIGSSKDRYYLMVKRLEVETMNAGNYVKPNPKPRAYRDGFADVEQELRAFVAKYTMKVAVSKRMLKPHKKKANFEDPSGA